MSACEGKTVSKREAWTTLRDSWRQSNKVSILRSVAGGDKSSTQPRVGRESSELVEEGAARGRASLARTRRGNRCRFFGTC